jgi:ATP-dependent RNA helicase DDX55/SPB4
MAQEPAVEKKPKSFEALTPELSSWILDFAQSSGFARTTPVQAMAIPLLMGNKDLVVEVCGLFTPANGLANVNPGRHR